MESARLPVFDVVTFDCYGTLVDWRGGIADAFRTVAGRAGHVVNVPEVLDHYIEIEAGFEAGAYRSYRDVLRLTAMEIGRRLGWTLTGAEAEFLADSLPTWPVFPDTIAALGAIRGSGIEVGILSNVDDKLLDGTLKSLGVPIDLRVTAEEVRGYKPGPAHFETAAQKIGARSWLHAAQSLFHDIEPANQRELPSAWINRQAEPRPNSPVPDWEYTDLRSLADALLEARAG
ncbi:MAG: HAD-IA family hydrolase [Acidobacteriota bacterium]|nr:HAD-IA family hydrolase [Acidobacteriota bacterium]